MVALKQYFASDDTHPLILPKLAQKLFGSDWLAWEPRTIYEEIKAHGFAPMSQVNAGKINAFRVAKITYGPWLDWDTFEHVGHAFNNSISNFELIQPLTVGFIATTLDILNKMKNVPYADEVLGYIAACAKHDELDYLPDPMDIAQSKLCKAMYRCLDCGNVDTDDLKDGKCDVCCGRFDHELMGGNPNPQYADRGTNIVKFMEFDYSPVAKRFKVLRNSNSYDLQLGDTSDDVQVAKLLSIDDYRKTFQNNYNLQYDNIKDWLNS